MKLYVARSWRNPSQPDIVNKLRAAGHVVYDFRNPAPGNHGFAWSSVDPNWQFWNPQTYREKLKHANAVAGFAKDFHAMKWAEAGVLVMPCGRSAHLEAGYFVGAGKPLFILLSDQKAEPELMYLMADHICLNPEELLEQLAKCRCQTINADIEETAKLYASKLEADLCDRRGLRHAFEEIDEDIQDEIRRVWIDIFAQAIHQQVSPLIHENDQLREQAKTTAHLCQIGKRLRTQDNRATANPAFCVQLKKRDVGLDPAYAEHLCYRNSEDGDVVYDDDPNFEEPIGDQWDTFGYVDRWETVMVAFTEEACNQYLAVDGHNVRSRAFRQQVRIYVESFNRCEEMITIREALLKTVNPVSSQVQTFKP